MAVQYMTKKAALAAKICFHCQSKMNGAYVVFTIHGDPKPGGQGQLHFPLCSEECLTVFGAVVAEVMNE